MVRASVRLVVRLSDLSELREYDFVLAMGRRSLRASLQGIQAIKKTLKRKKWSQTYLAGAVNCSRQTIWSFLQGNPIDCDVFMEVCTQLEMNWEEIAEPEVPEQEQNNSPDIDALVQEVRSRAYADIKERTGTMRMLRVNHPVPVTDIYVDLNILKRVSSDFSFSDWRKEFEFDWRSFDRLGLGQVEQERVPAIEKIQDCRKLMVLGKPGSGKTTLLKSLATACIEEKLAWDEPEYVPVFITLREFAEDAAEEEKFSLCDAIQQQFDRWGVADAAKPILQQGRALILLDGLDEVLTSQSEFVVRQMRRFCGNYGNNRFIITCRTQSLKSHFEGFTEAEIADFTPKQVEQFIKNWFAVVVGNAEAAELAERLIGQLQQNKPIAELAVTPILLNLTCSVFRDERGKLPTKRAELYEKGLKDLLQRLARPEALGEEDLFKRLTSDDKENLLAQVAYTLFEENNYFPEQRKLERLIANHLQIQRSEAEQVLRLLEAQHGLIIERSEGYFSFSHLTFQEYFTAKYIVDSSTPEEAFQRLVSHITEPRWREVFLLAVEMLDSADELLQLMQERVDKIMLSDAELEKFINWIKVKSDLVATPYKRATIRACYFNIILEQDIIQTLKFIDSIDKKCSDALEQLYDTTDTAIEARASYQYIDIGLIFANHIGCDLDLCLTRVLSYATYNIADDSAFSNNIFSTIKDVLIRLFDYTISLASKRELKQSLQLLREQLPNGLDKEKFKECWKVNHQVWAEHLRTVMIEHRNIGHGWQFSDAHKKQLQQYYNANELLVDCLNSDCNASPEVKKEIEKNLLLPDRRE